MNKEIDSLTEKIIDKILNYPEAMEKAKEYIRNMDGVNERIGVNAILQNLSTVWSNTRPWGALRLPGQRNRLRCG